MARFLAVVQHAYMANGRHTPHFLREWRKAQGRSLESVAEAIVLLSEQRVKAGDGPALTMTHATLSRIERFKLPYNQHLLELLAEIYGTDEGSLIMRDPSKPEAPHTLLASLTPAQQVQAIEIIKAIQRTGTDG